MSEGKKLHLGRKQLIKFAEVQQTFITGHRDINQLRTRFLRQQLPGHDVAVMLHLREQDFVAGFDVLRAPGLGHEVDALGGAASENDFVGAARTFLDGGYLFRFKFTPDRLHYTFTDARLNDLVADNLDKFDITESESLLIGRDFGITTDIETGPNGNLFVVSNTNSAVYEISGKQPTLFTATLTGGQETPPNSSTATGTATIVLSPDELTARVPSKEPAAARNGQAGVARPRIGRGACLCSGSIARPRVSGMP